MTSSSSASDPLHGLNPEQLLDIASLPVGSEADTVRLSAPDLPSLEEVAAAFPDLEVLELIGRGGMSAVFRARQLRLNRVVALKVLPKSLAALPGFAERFTREGQVLARLTHPHIVTVHDFGECGGFWFLIMEHVDGVNLRQAMRAGRFTPEQALQVIPAICDALQFAHGQGVLHRDIKPENILLDAKGGIKIADFGIAKILGEDAEGAMLLTQSGARLGTAPYMAPEQIEKPASVDHRADIYSLGVVFYEMLTGELPLGRFAAPSELAAVGGNLDEIVFRALEKERARRQQSAEEFKTQVAEAGTSQKLPQAPKRLQRYWMIPGGLFLCALLGWLMERWTMTGSSAIAGGGGLPQRAIASGTMLMGMLLWGLAVPLWLRLVPRNSFYGVRLPSTLDSDKRWYEVNAIFGKQMFWWSLTVIGAGIAGFYQLPRHQDAYPWAAVTLEVVAIAAPVAATLWWMRQHPVNAPPRPRGRWASWCGQAVVAVVVAFFIKGFILEAYRMAGKNEAGVPQGSHWIASKLDTGFGRGDLIAFEHESGHPYLSRVVKREDKGLLLKRGGVEEAFLVPWDKVIGKLLFSHFMPDAVKAAGAMEDRTPKPEPPNEGSVEALETEPVLRFLRAKRVKDDWKQAPMFDPQGRQQNNEEADSFAAKVRSDGMGYLSPNELRVQFWFEHPDFDEESALNVELLQINGLHPGHEPIMQGPIPQDFDMYLVNVRLGEVVLPYRVNVRLAYSIGTWKHIAAHKADSTDATEFGNQLFTTGIGDDHKHHSFIGWTGPKHPNVQYNAIALLKSGRRIRAYRSGNTIRNTDGILVSSNTFPVPLRDIETFEIRRREVKTVEFRDVVIPPLP